MEFFNRDLAWQKWQEPQNNLSFLIFKSLPWEATPDYTHFYKFTPFSHWHGSLFKISAHRIFSFFQMPIFELKQLLHM